MGPRENPFAWQEHGASTALLRWCVTLLYGVAGAVAASLGVYFRDLSVLLEPWSYVVMVFVGAGVASLFALFYGANVFAREKVAGTAKGVILTGAESRTIYRGKIFAMYRALLRTYVALGAAAGIALLLGWTRWEIVGATLAAVGAALVMPLSAGLVAMVYSASARSSGEAIAWLILTPFLALLCSVSAFLPMAVLSRFGKWGSLAIIPVGIVLLVLGVIGLWRSTLAWSALRMSFTFALAQLATLLLFMGMAAVAEGPGGQDLLSTEVGIVVAILVSVLIGAGFLVFAYRLGVSVFERCMLAEAAAGGRRGFFGLGKRK